MNIENVRVIYFSPTGTSRQVARAIAEGVEGGAAEDTDLTLPDYKTCSARKEPQIFM